MCSNGFSTAFARKSPKSILRSFSCSTMSFVRRLLNLKRVGSYLAVELAQSLAPVAIVNRLFPAANSHCWNSFQLTDYETIVVPEKCSRVICTSDSPAEVSLTDFPALSVNSTPKYADNSRSDGSDGFCFPKSSLAALIKLPRSPNLSNVFSRSRERPRILNRSSNMRFPQLYCSNHSGLRNNNSLQCEKVNTDQWIMIMNINESTSLNLSGPFYSGFLAKKRDGNPAYGSDEQACIERTITKLITQTADATNPVILLGKIQSGKTTRPFWELRHWRSIMIMTSPLSSRSQPLPWRSKLANGLPKNLPSSSKATKLKFMTFSNFLTGLTQFELNQKLCFCCKKANTQPRPPFADSLLTPNLPTTSRPPHSPH